MNIAHRLDEIHLKARSYKWLHYFYVFLRIFLAYGFITSGLVKVMGERFAAGLSENHPMGQYLAALHNTGVYYTFIGIMQILSAILLLISRTVVLGAFIYLPVIINIFVLSYAVRFEGSSLTSPLMVLGCLYLICWNYDKVKYLLPFNHSTAVLPKPTNTSFPWRFFATVIAVMAAILLFLRFGFELVPRNSLKDCNAQFAGTNRTEAGALFCECIHNKGMPLDSAIVIYSATKDDAVVWK